MNADVVAVVLASVLVVAVAVIIYLAWRTSKLSEARRAAESLAIERAAEFARVEIAARWWREEAQRLTRQAESVPVPEEVPPSIPSMPPLQLEPAERRWKTSAPTPIDPATGGERPFEPQGLPRTEVVVPDSEVDGATLDSLVVRAASVRGDRTRRDMISRTDAYAIRVLGEGYSRPTLASVVASGSAHPEAHLLTMQACQNLVVRLGRLGAGLDAAWRADARDELHGLLRDACTKVRNGLIETVRARQLPAEIAEVELTCLLTDLVDPSARRHLMFRVGGGNVLQRREDGWVPLLSEHPTGPAPGSPVQLELLTAEPGATLLVTTRAGMQALALPTVGEYFLTQWQSGHPELMDFLRQVGARVTATDDDRTMVCLWDFPPLADANSTVRHRRSTP